MLLSVGQFYCAGDSTFHFSFIDQLEDQIRIAFLDGFKGDFCFRPGLCILAFFSLDESPE